MAAIKSSSLSIVSLYHSVLTLGICSHVVSRIANVVFDFRDRRFVGAGSVRVEAERRAAEALAVERRAVRVAIAFSILCKTGLSGTPAPGQLAADAGAILLA